MYNSCRVWLHQWPSCPLYARDDFSCQSRLGFCLELLAMSTLAILGLHQGQTTRDIYKPAIWGRESPRAWSALPCSLAVYTTCTPPSPSFPSSSQVSWPTPMPSQTTILAPTFSVTGFMKTSLTLLTDECKCCIAASSTYILILCVLATM